MKKLSLYALMVTSLLALFQCSDNDSPTPPPVLSAPSVTGLFQPEGQLTINFAFTGTFQQGNVFTVQLSDGNGNFSAPVAIGTLNGTTASPITVTLPATVANGTGYRIRIVSTLPAVTGPDNGSNLSITAPTITISSVSASGLTIIPGRRISVSAASTGTFATTNTFTLQLSDANGSFSAPTNLVGPLEGTNYNASIFLNLPTNVTAGNSYRLRWIASSPAIAGAPSEPFAVVIPALSVPMISGNLVVGGALNVTVNASNGPWEAGNRIQLQLSDANGDFSAPTIINTLTTQISGPLPAFTPTLPSNLPAGANYRMRAVTTNPAVVGPSTSPFLIAPLPTLTLETATPVFTKMYAGSIFNIFYMFKLTRTGTFNPNTTFRLELSAPNQDFTGSGQVTTLGAISSSEVSTLNGAAATTTVLVALKNLGTAPRQIRIATNHGNVTSNALSFSIGQTELTSFSGTFENTVHSFNTERAVTNSNSNQYYNNQRVYLYGNSPTTFGGAVTMRAFVIFTMSGENIATGTQSVILTIHLLDINGVVVESYRTPSAITLNGTVSGTATGYTGSIGAVTLEKVGTTSALPATLSVQGVSYSFRMQ